MNKLKIEVVEATTEHAKHVLKHLRQADKQELVSMHGECSHQMLEDFRAYSHRAFAVLLDGEPALLCGISGAGLIGVPWAVGTDRMKEVAQFFTKEARRRIDGWQEEHPVLVNRVSASNALHIRWLKLLGFEMGAPRTDMSMDGSPFIPFVRMRKAVV